MTQRMLAALGVAFLFGATQATAMAASPAWLSFKQETDEKIAAERSKLKALARQADEAEQAKAAITGMLQQAGTFASFIGDSDAAMAAFDEIEAYDNKRTRRDADDLERLAASRAQDAIPAIVAEARKRQVVILNEAHHVPMHRAFAMQLARELRKIGYTWLACETFSDDPLEKKYVGPHTGYYTQEPVFANFIRDAMATGWKLVPYEHIEEDDDQPHEWRLEHRETGQARKLAERIFAKDPKAKVFIFVGYAHLAEKPGVGHGPGTAMMGAQFKHLTGIDPLTIDQTTMIAHTRAESEHRLFDKALEHAKRSGPFVLRAPRGEYQVFTPYRFAVDMQVVHQRYPIDPQTGRPQWLQTLAGFTAREVPAHLLPNEGKRLVAARPAGQPEDAIPADVVTVEAGKPAPRFMLPPGDYIYSYLE
ncbi:hypothetical protein [Pseudoduganella sp.]|uniref:hypothetical protein n=1 Tax=Pseudoduganella sp. TaxID=1880898 RepID=UPI0035B49817